MSNVFSPMLVPPSPRGPRPLHGSHRAALPTWKRVLDLTCCLGALPLFALVLLAVALVLSLSSPGPIFFRQERVGLLGRRFLLYKFRTMHVSAAPDTHRAHVAALLKTNAPMTKLDGARDRRLVFGGWLLRATGLDELPQLINIARGDMSIVGPRPCLAYEYEQYTPEQRGRFAAVPGVTGLWQVSGKNRTTFAEMIRLDLEYAHRRSLTLDARIIARTLPAICRQITDVRAERRRHRRPAGVAAPVPSRTAAGLRA